MKRLGVALLLGVLATWGLSLTWPYDVVADVHPEIGEAPASVAHWLGTDHMGRDVFRRLVRASEAFVPAGLLAALVAGVAGGAVGTVSGWFGGAAEVLVRYVTGVVASLPRLVLVLLAGAIFGPRPTVLAVATGLAYAPALAEAVHARLESLRRAEFVLAARAHGLAEGRILAHHLLWVNCRGLVARHLLQAFGFFLLVETTLSYLGGFGVPEPTPSWGNMLAFEFGVPDGNVLAWAAPAAAIWLAVLGTALVAEEAPDA